MQRLTQTRPDNCWQTCVAMLLGRPVESLPAQHLFGERDRYVKALRVFLDKHYNVTYVETGPEMIAVFPQTFHLMIGETVRTPIHDAWHAVIGLAGKYYWDVHPSRAGLKKVHGFGLLVPTPQEWKSTWVNEGCLCSDCVVADCQKSIVQ